MIPDFRAPDGLRIGLSPLTTSFAEMFAGLDASAEAARRMTHRRLTGGARGMILDDFDSRPGSATSLLRTIVGACLRGLGGWASVADLIRLLGAVGVSEAHARTAVLRVSRKGLLVSNGNAEYTAEPGCRPHAGARRPPHLHLPPDARRRPVVPRLVLDSGNAARRAAPAAPPARLDRMRNGRARAVDLPGLPHGRGRGHLRRTRPSALRDALRDRDTASGGHAGGCRRRWWDLAALGSLHRGFLEATAGLAEFGSTGSTAFAAWIRTLDEWRVIPYLDPGLPPGVLPADWPGFASVARFEQLSARFADAGRSFAGIIGD